MSQIHYAVSQDAPAAPRVTGSVLDPNLFRIPVLLALYRFGSAPAAARGYGQ
jgi:hypothetical protein